MRRIGLVVIATVMSALLAGCSAAGPSAAKVASELGALHPLPNPRDNTASCEDAGCVGLITTDRVSVYKWSDEATAQRFATSLDADVVGRYVLSYSGSEQKVTSDEARAAFEARTADLVTAD